MHHKLRQKLCICPATDQDEQDNPDVEADEAADAAAAGTTNFRPSTHAPGPWFERIMG